MSIPSSVFQISSLLHLKIDESLAVAVEALLKHGLGVEQVGQDAGAGLVEIVLHPQVVLRQLDGLLGDEQLLVAFHQLVPILLHLHGHQLAVVVALVAGDLFVDFDPEQTLLVILSETFYSLHFQKQVCFLI